MSDTNLLEITGEVTRNIRFDDGYTVLDVVLSAALQGKRKGTAVKLVGNMPQLVDGMNIFAKATEIEHPRYGTQYKVTEISEQGFNRLESIVDYLSSSVFHGIGRSYARKIADAFGLDTMSILDADHERIRDVEGIGATKAEQFVAQWKEQRGIHKVMAGLMGFGMTMALAMKVHSQFGDSAVEIIHENPYALIDVHGVGFHKADDMALKMGIPRNSIFRIKAAIRYMLDTVMWTAGHCYLEMSQLVIETGKLLNNEIGNADIATAVKALEKDMYIIIEESRVYLSHVHSAEVAVADNLKKILGYSKKTLYENIDDLREDFERYGINKDIQFAPEQEEAIFTALNSRVCVITGGPGTGKTTITKAICQLFKAKNIHYELCSPTGRASKRLAEATGDEAKTIHRLLGYTGGDFEFDSTNTLDTDCVLIDEFSMVDILLFRFLLDALEYDTRLILVGDHDQLPSVGPGTVLHDVINSGVIPVVKLQRIFRQSKGSAIIDAAHQILHGEMPDLASPAKSKGKNCMLVTADDKELLLSHILSLVETHLPAAGIKHSDIQILTPMREKGLGINDLNPMLQKLLNPPSEAKQEINSEFRILRVGDRIMQIRNDYKKDVFNGDVGIVAGINKAEGAIPVLFVKYPDKESLVEYEQGDWSDLQLAYACTVHKSQGSEYPVVILVLHPSQYNMLQRNLFYTGLTRAKKMCIIAGTTDAIQTAVSNNKIRARNTTLRQRLLR